MTTVLQAKLGRSWALLSPGSAATAQRRGSVRTRKEASESSYLSDDAADP